MTKSLSLGVLVVLLGLCGPALAQSSSVAAPDVSSVAPDVSSSAPAIPSEPPVPDQAVIDAWQGVISAQILAFRTHDAPGALKLASAEFHAKFTDPEQFYAAIIASGYQPIADSTGENFGPYEMIGETLVLQDLKFTTKDQAVYEAIYQLTRETDGWRVSGVQLIKTQAIGV